MFKYLFLAFLFINSPAYSASFDCKKARSDFEKFICSNQSIDEADREMGEAYRNAVKKIKVKNYVRSDQQMWLRYRYSSCRPSNFKSPSESEIKMCLNILSERVAELNSMMMSEIFANHLGEVNLAEEEMTIQIIKLNGKPTMKMIGDRLEKPGYISNCWRYVDLKVKGNDYFEFESGELLAKLEMDSLRLVKSISCEEFTIGPEIFKKR